MLNRLNFNHLYYFHVIAKEGSLAKATLILNVSQPTLSQQLRQFEENLGRELFGRKGRSLKLNDDGKYIFKYTSKIFSTAENILTSFTYNRRVGNNTLYRIGITQSASMTYATQLLGVLLQDEEIAIKVVEGDVDKLLADLYSSQLDFIITENVTGDIINKDVKKIHLTTPKYFFVSGNKFKPNKSEMPQLLNDMPYFKYSINNELQKEVDNYFFENNILPMVIGESENVNIIAAATEINRCFSVLPESLIKNAVKENRLKVLGEFPTKEAHVSALYIEAMTTKEIEDVIGRIKAHC